MRPFHIIITCEHGGNLIPSQYASHFTGCEDQLESHRGWDIGALQIAQKLSTELNAKLFQTRISRLLVDCNRSVFNPEIYSDRTNRLSNNEKEEILKEYYYSYRNKVERYIRKISKQQRVLHVSVHTFVPEWNGVERSVDVGLLFDEARTTENIFCNYWKNELEKKLPDKSVKLNEPYKGADDGFTTYLRKKFSEQNYLGIEIEVNHKWANTPELNEITTALYFSLVLNFTHYSYSTFENKGVSRERVEKRKEIPRRE
ncbi:MAG: N-formylglutamate amidohydrolase [Cyclobacteriaceae bacterium]|nr:N-formylglutamate amidohydrolase [Cyclobacteriaceae bacterium]